MNVKSAKLIAPIEVLGALLLVIGLFLVCVPLLSLCYLFVQKGSMRSFADFGISCDPSTLLLTFIYTGSTVVLQMGVGMFAALAVFLFSQGRTAVLICLITGLTLPYAIPSTIGFTLWEFGLASGGTVQELVFPHGSPLDGTWSRFAVLIVLSVWQFFPFSFLLILAAFLAIPRDMLAAARSDGASDYQIARFFLIPIALPVIAAAAVLRIVLMATKLDTPLAFDLTSSNEYACLASVRIYSSLGLGGDLVPLGLVLLLGGSILSLLSIYSVMNARWGA